MSADARRTAGPLWSRLAAGALTAGLMAGCAAVPPPQAGRQPASSPAAASAPSTPRATATPTPTPTPTTPASTPTPTPEPSPTEPAEDTRTGRERDRPYVVNSIVVVSRDHPISRRYRPENPGPHGLEKAVAKALAAMVADAREDGVRIRVRSGYRSYAEQEALLKRKIVEYGNEKLARRYNAEPGKSEHQTGLAVDLWDGVTWGTGVRNTRAGKWLWKHSREYGFILRYPPGKEAITGYAYEPWHFRYIGKADSRKFKANHTLTLEEYLGIE